jgi:hypothetical protein
MEQILAALDRITELSDDELGSLRDQLVAFLDEIASNGQAVIASAELAQLETLANAADVIKTEQDRREARRVELAAKFSVMDVPSDRRPQPRSAGFATALTASGRELRDGSEIVAELASVVRGSVSRPVAGRTVVASLKASTDAPVISATDSAETTTRILRDQRSGALTAAGGFATPAPVRYDLPSFGESQARPLRDAFPALVAERGQITFLRNLGLADLAASASVWDNSDDTLAITDPSHVKPSLRAPLPDDVTVQTQAIVSSIIHGNLAARSYPEHLERVLELAALAHTVLAEKELLAQLDGLSVAVTVAAGSPALGATRQVLPNLGFAAAGVRSRMRLSPDAPLQILLPGYYRDVIRGDLARSQPGDRTLALSNAEVDALFAPYNLRPVYLLDHNVIGAQAAGALVLPSDTLTAYLTVPGSISVLDAGTLSIGVYRDQGLIEVNDFGVFEETFEALVVHGLAPVKLTISGAAPSGVSRAAA